jgi:hypothetical protein
MVEIHKKFLSEGGSSAGWLMVTVPMPLISRGEDAVEFRYLGPDSA